MIKTRTHHLLVAVALLGSGNQTLAANSFFMVPGNTSATPGEQVELQLWMDFESTTVGGALDIAYDSDTLQFDDWQSESLGDPDVRREPDLFDGFLDGIAFGDLETGTTGVNLVGTLLFTVSTGAPLQLTTTVVSMDGTGAFAVPWMDFQTFQPLPVDFGSAQVRVVPLPGALWLFGGGVLGIFGLRRPGTALKTTFASVDEQ